MTVDPLLPWLTAINSLIALGSFIYAWLTARAKGNSEKLSAVEKIVVEHERRIQAIEGELRHLPDKDSVVELKISMAKVEGAISALTERLGTFGTTVTRIEDYLRSNGDH
jgi:uncharacterized coiled-coil protein SlyX